LQDADGSQPKQAVLVPQLKVYQGRTIVISRVKNQFTGRGLQLRATKRGSKKGAAQEKGLHNTVSG